MSSNENEINITVRTMTGKSVPFTTDRNASIKELCYYLQEHQGHPVGSGYEFMYKAGRIDTALWFSFYGVQDGDSFFMVNRMRGGVMLPVYFIDKPEVIPLTRKEHEFTFIYAPTMNCKLEKIIGNPTIEQFKLLFGNETFASVDMELIDADSDVHQTLLKRDVCQRLISEKEGWVADDEHVFQDCIRFMTVKIEGNLPGNHRFTFLRLLKDCFQFNQGDVFTGGAVVPLKTENQFLFSIPSTSYSKEFVDKVCTLMWMNDNEIEGSTWEEQPQEVLEHILDHLWKFEIEEIENE